VSERITHYILFCVESSIGLQWNNSCRCVGSGAEDSMVELVSHESDRSACRLWRNLPTCSQRSNYSSTTSNSVLSRRRDDLSRCGLRVPDLSARDVRGTVVLVGALREVLDVDGASVGLVTPRLPALSACFVLRSDVDPRAAVSRSELCPCTLRI